MKFTEAFVKTLRKVGPVLLAWFVLTQLFDQWVLVSTQKVMMSDKGQSGIWIFATLSILSSILTPLVATLLVLSSWTTLGNNAVAAFKFFRAHLSWLIREQLRVFGKVILWSLLFILPGIWKFMELSLVPWVVCLDPEYQAGRKDSLQASREVFYRIWGRLTLLGLVFWLLIPFLMTSFDSYRSYSAHPMSAFGLSLVDVCIFILFQWLVLKLWQRTRVLSVPGPVS